MTENEAIKELGTSIDLAKMCTQTSERKREVEAYNIAIQALSEIQQYRAIGTVEECKMAMGKVFVKKRTILHGNYYCCECGTLAEKSGHCRFCGQSLY